MRRAVSHPRRRSPATPLRPWCGASFARRGSRRDTIEDGVTGFLFDDYTPADFMRCAMRAVDQFRDTDAWEEMMREAMARDFGWEKSAARYLTVYRRVLGLPAVR